MQYQDDFAESPLTNSQQELENRVYETKEEILRKKFKNFLHLNMSFIVWKDRQYNSNDVDGL